MDVVIYPGWIKDHSMLVKGTEGRSILIAIVCLVIQAPDSVTPQMNDALADNTSNVFAYYLHKTHHRFASKSIVWYVSKGTVINMELYMAMFYSL